MRIAVLFPLAVLTLAAGCSPQAQPPVAVTGKVTLKGKAVSGVMVQFVPTETTGTMASGRTDASGSYTLFAAAGGEGVRPGQYKVVISRLLKADGQEIPEGFSPLTSGGKESLPKFYSDPNETFLTAVVPPATPASVDFPLTGQGGAGGGAGGAMGGVRVGR